MPTARHMPCNETIRVPAGTSKPDYAEATQRFFMASDLYSATCCPVDGLAQKVGVTVMPGVLLEHVEIDPPH